MAGHQQGFTDVDHAFFMEPGVISIAKPVLPDGADEKSFPRPDNYQVAIDYFDASSQVIYHTDTTIMLGYPSSITEQRFRDMIMILSPAYNGGYSFSHYQWYCDDMPLIGQNEPYLYMPEELTVGYGTSYSVGLVREGETAEIRTCPIHIKKDNADRPAPQYNYLSVVPSVVSRYNPVVHILCRYEGSYRVYSPSGTLIEYGYFYPGSKDAYRLNLPATPGVYVVSLSSPSADVERERTVRVVVQ